MKQILKIAVATLALASFAATAQAEGDAAKGEKYFKKKCKTCHMIGENAKNRIGPPLNNIVDAKAGSQEGYKSKSGKTKYSKGMIKVRDAGLVWDAETLDKYLTKPKKVVKGTKMNIPGGGVKEPADRADLIAYLKSHTK